MKRSMCVVRRLVAVITLFTLLSSPVVAEVQESFGGASSLGWDQGASPVEVDVIVPGTAVPFPECGFQDGVCGGSCPDGKSCKTVAGQGGAPATCSCQPTVACKLEASNPQCTAGDCPLKNGEFRFCTTISAGGQNGCGCKADSCAVRIVDGRAVCNGNCATGHCEGDSDSCACVPGCKFIIKDGAPACDGHCAGGQFCKLNDNNDACTCPEVAVTPTPTPTPNQHQDPPAHPPIVITPPSCPGTWPTPPSVSCGGGSFSISANGYWEKAPLSDCGGWANKCSDSFAIGGGGCLSQVTEACTAAGGTIANGSYQSTSPCTFVECGTVVDYCATGCAACCNISTPGGGGGGQPNPTPTPNSSGGGGGGSCGGKKQAGPKGGSSNTSDNVCDSAECDRALAACSNNLKDDCVGNGGLNTGSVTVTNSCHFVDVPGGSLFSDNCELTCKGCCNL